MAAALMEPGHALWTVYEVFNIRLREIYVGVTQLPLEAQLKRVREAPPPAIAHWRYEGHDITIREVATFDRDSDAVKFLKPYSKELSMPIWKVIPQ